MKIRYDFITNSSSTSFVLAAQEVATVLVASALIAQAVYAANKAASDASNESGAITGSVLSSTFATEMFRLSDADDLKTLESKEAAVQQQLGAYKKQYSGFMSGKNAGDAAGDTTADQTDSIYNQYFDYMYKKLDQIAAAKYTKIINAAKTKAEEKAQKDWIAAKQHELSDVLDEKAFLQQSGAANSEATGALMKKIEESEKEIRQSLSDNGATADYTPEGVSTAKTYDADTAPDIDFSRPNDEKALEIQNLESEKQSLAGQDSERFEMLKSRQDELYKEINETKENEISWDYMTGKAGITRPTAAESLESADMTSFTSHSTQSMKSLYSGAFKKAAGLPSDSGTGDGEDVVISPEVMKWVKKGLASFVNSRFKSKYASQSKNLFSITDSAIPGDPDAFSAEGDIFTAIGAGALKSTLEIAKSDILTANFSSLSVNMNTNDLFSWQGLLKYIRDRKPLEKVTKNGLSNEKDGSKRVKGENIRLNNFRKGS